MRYSLAPQSQDTQAGALVFTEICEIVSMIRDFNRNPSFEQGAMWADTTMLDKACKWLENVNTDDYMDSGIFQMSDMIMDFKKAMEV